MTAPRTAPTPQSKAGHTGTLDSECLAKRTRASAWHATMDCGRLDTRLSYFWTVTIASPPPTWSAWWACSWSIPHWMPFTAVGSAFFRLVTSDPRAWVPKCRRICLITSPLNVLLLFIPAFCDGS